MKEDLFSSVSGQLLDYQNAVKQLSDCSLSANFWVEKLVELAQCANKNERIIITFDAPYEFKARHLFEELLGFYRQRRAPINVAIFNNLPSNIKPKDKVFWIHFGVPALTSSTQSAFDRMPQLSLSLLTEQFQSKGLTHCNNHFSLAHFGLLSLALHLICEAFEPEFQLSINNADLIKELYSNALTDTLKCLELSLSRAESEWNLYRLEQVLTSKILNNSGVIFTAGNGGSACDLFDLGVDIPVVHLVDSGYITCVSNDLNYEEVFSRAAKIMNPAKDLIFTLTTSGRSKNIIKALHQANESKIHSVLLSGGDGAECTKLANTILLAGEYKTNRIQEIHSLILRGTGIWLRGALN